jgi:hypothetical protein
VPDQSRRTTFRFRSIRATGIRCTILCRTKARSQSHHWEDQMALASKYSEDVIGVSFVLCTQSLPNEHILSGVFTPFRPNSNPIEYHPTEAKTIPLSRIEGSPTRSTSSHVLSTISIPCTLFFTYNENGKIFHRPKVGHQSDPSTFLLGLKPSISFPSSSLPRVSRSSRLESLNARTQALFTLLHFRESEIRAAFSTEVIRLATG